MDRGRVRRELHDAVNVWASVTNLTFREQRADAQIEVAFKRLAHNDGFDFDGRGNILAHAFFPGDGLGINGDVHFDEDEQWFMLDDGPGAEGGISLFAVAAHEFGHSLGLSHSSVPGALMTPHYQELPRDFQLPEDDMHGIMQIYGIKGRLWDRIKPYTPDARPPDGEPAAPGRPGGRPAPAPPRIAPTTAPPPHSPHSPHSPGRKRPDKPDKPDTCNTAYDTVAVIRREVFIFKDQYLWRIGDRGLEQGYPAEIKRLWGGLPQNLTHVDAVYERSDRKIVFFVGKEYYVYAADKLVPGFPKPLTDLGLPSDLTHIDDAMVWGHNGRTYLFSGSMYWRLDEEIGKIELDYPRDMAMWRGVGYNIDAVAQLNGITYFFKGKGYWKFNDMNMRVEHTIPKPSAPFWMGCPEPKGGWFDWEENSIDIYNDIKSSQFFDYAADDDDDDSAAPQITSTLTVMCLCLSFSSYLSL